MFFLEIIKQKYIKFYRGIYPILFVIVLRIRRFFSTDCTPERIYISCSYDEKAAESLILLSLLLFSTINTVAQVYCVDTFNGIQY